MSKTPNTQYIDVSHTIEEGVITYKGLPGPLVCDFLSREASREHYDDGTTFQIGKIEMVGNTGTYIDSPFHRYEDGIDISELPLSSIVDLDGIVIRMVDRPKRAIDKRDLVGVEILGKAVLIHTGWDKHWNTDQYFDGHPFLTRDAADYLVESGVKLVGIDSLNIDDTADGERPVHTILLGAGIPIVEHLCHLDRLPDSRFRFYCAPAKVKGMGTFPVRAFAISQI